MNKLQTNYNGGFPFDLDDIRFEQNAIREAFKGMLSALSIPVETNGILSGCESDGTDVTAGFVVIDHEILYFPGSVLPGITPGPGKLHHFRLSVSYDSNGLETFENGSSHDTWEIRTAELIYNTPSGSYVDLTGVRLAEGEKWRTVGDPGEPSILNGWSLGNSVRFRKSPDGGVVLRGSLTNTLASALSVLLNMPLGYRPNFGPLNNSYRLTCTIVLDIATTPVVKTGILLISSLTGVIVLDPASTPALISGATTVTVELDSISYSATKL
jgi:hypothetical protein